MQLIPNEKRTHESMRPTFPIYEAVKCFALNKLQTTGKRTACSEENNMNCRRVPLCKIARMTKRIPHTIHKNPAADFILFLRNILYATPVSTAPECEATNLLHIILYFVVDALCIQSILVNQLHCRS